MDDIILDNISYTDGSDSASGDDSQLNIIDEPGDGGIGVLGAWEP